MWQHNVEEAKEILQDLDQENINKKFSEMVMECMGYTACGKENEVKILTMWKNGAKCLEDYNYSNSLSTQERIQDTKLMCPKKEEILSTSDQKDTNEFFSELVTDCMGYTACGKTHQAIILTMWKDGAECLEGYNYSNTCNVPERVEDIKLMCPNISLDCSHINNTDL